MTAIAQSATWESADPAASIVVSCYRRPDYVDGLFAALEATIEDCGDAEVVLVDNGSGDDTFARLARCVERGSIPARAVRLDENRGPGAGRNAGVAHARGRVLAFTDDDCLPDPGWLGALMRAIDDGAEVVQAPVVPAEGPRTGRDFWAHTLHVRGPTPWFETANVAYRRSAFDAAGGFDETDEVTGRAGAKAFGEDAVLGGRVAAVGRRAWAPEAVVRHRLVPGTFASHLRSWWLLGRFPGLLNLTPVGRATLHRRVFLAESTLRFDVALVSVASAALSRRAGFLLGGLPWARTRWREIRRQGTPPEEAMIRLAQHGVLESVGFVSLLVGSVRHRRLVL